MLMDTQPQTNTSPQQASDQHPHRSSAPIVAPVSTKKKLSKPVLIIGSIAVVLISATGTALALKQLNGSAHVATNQAATTTKKQAAPPIASDPSLQTDITDIDSLSGVDTTNLSTIDSNLNDREQQIAVPTS